MNDSKKKTGIVPWIAALLLGLPVLYFGSFGPACWLVSHANANADWLPFCYRPIVSGLSMRPTRVSRAIEWYSCLGAARGWQWLPDGIPMSDEEWLAVEWVWMSYAAPPAAKGI
jgi:hypothetical protein